MKKVVVITLACFVYRMAYPQCTPNAPTGNPGLTPAPPSVSCIERGVPYDFTMYFENFTSFNCSGFTADVNWARIDNLSNLPCGLTWQADQPTYAAGETGCIRITGTSTDAVGQYALVVTMTFELDIFGSSYRVSGTIAQLQQQLQQYGCSSPNVNTDYYSRVINPTTSCPAIGSLPNRTAGSCDDSDACTTDACTPAGCSHTPLNCDDSNACTADACAPAAGCTHTSVTCNDGNACTTDACNPATGCTTAPLVCNDGDACTTDACNPATGCTTAPLVCNDGDACTTDACNPATGCTTAPLVCDDGDACTTDACNPATGCTTAPLVCDDADVCTTDDCAPATGCVFTPIQPCNVGINNAASNTLGLELYPNPSSGTVEINTGSINTNRLLLRIFDLTGENIYTETVPVQSDIIQIDLGGLSKGIYVLSLSSEKLSVNKKLVIY